MPFPIPLPGANAFKTGFLSQGYATDVVEQVNKGWQVILPPGCGNALVLLTALVNTIDLSNLRIPETDYPGRVTNSSSATQPRLSVSRRTTLMKSTFAQNDLVLINGLGLPIPVSANQSLYLRYDVTAQSATIGVGNWPQYSSPIGWVNANAVNLVQKYAYISLARIVAHNSKNTTFRPDLVIQATGAENSPMLDVYLLVRGGLALVPQCYSGANVVLIQPWHAGY